MEELIRMKVIQIKKQQAEQELLQLERKAEEEARFRIESHKLNCAIQYNDIRTLQLLAGGCEIPCRINDDIECYKCLTTGSYDPIIKNKARIELDRITLYGNSI